MLAKKDIEMEEKKTCSCSSAPKLIFSCSGAADVGAIADRAARKLTADGAGKMYCMAGVGAKVGGIVASTQAAAKILAIDGCPLDCARLCLEQAGFTDYEHIRITDHGMDKGQSPATDDRIQTIVDLGKSALAE